MQKSTRRQFVAGATAVPLAASAARAMAGQLTPQDVSTCAGDLATYIGFGNKQSGGPGDNGCGDWLASEASKAGFAIERLPIEVPYFEAATSELRCGTVRAPVWPQPIVLPTGPQGFTGPVVRVDAAGNVDRPLKGAIALVDLPAARWSTAIAKPIRNPVEKAFAGGAGAVVLVTNGPTGKVIALNGDGRKPMFAGPTALLAPNDAAPFFAAAMTGASATLVVDGRGGKRPAFNFVAKLDRGKAKWLVVSTPRSGWFTCGGERGGGVAAWLHLARWASVKARDHNLAFICNSGHEYEYLGAEESLKTIAPSPAETAFWLHLGANFASRDWHEIGASLRPLPGTDSQRCLSVSPALLPTARTIFRGLAGLEAPYSSKDLSGGELSGIIEAGYAPVAGVFGVHRFHHVSDDDGRCVDAAQVAESIAAFRQLLEAATKSGA